MTRTVTALILVAALSACTSDPVGLDKNALIQSSIGPGELKSHDFTAQGSGSLLVVLSWNNRNIDLDLYITGVQCQSDPLTNCTVFAVSNDILTTQEATGFNVMVGEQYRIWVENLDDDRTVNYGLDYEVGA